MNKEPTQLGRLSFLHTWSYRQTRLHFVCLFPSWSQVLRLTHKFVFSYNYKASRNEASPLNYLDDYLMPRKSLQKGKEKEFMLSGYDSLFEGLRVWFSFKSTEKNNLCITLNWEIQSTRKNNPATVTTDAPTFLSGFNQERRWWKILLFGFNQIHIARSEQGRRRGVEKMIEVTGW